jgi:DNA-binding response OmpR family regulator
MKLLVAEDNVFFRRVFEQVLSRDYDLTLTQDGNEAWARLQQADAHQLAILDWVMPGLSGPEICRRVRQSSRPHSTYLILLTARNSAADVVSGFRAGADDCLSKPFDPGELRERVKVGRRIVDLRESFAKQSAELNRLVEREKQLEELLLGSACGPGSLASPKDWVGLEPSVSRYRAPQDGTRLDHFNFELTTGFWKALHE